MVDRTAADALSERIFTEINGAMSTLNLYLGWRLGLFAALAERGPSTAEELAAVLGLSERYLREWLGCMGAGRYLAYDAATRRFSVTPEQRVVYLEADHPAHALPNVGFVASLASVLPDLLRAFRDGSGVPFERYGQDLVDAQGAGYRPMFESELVGSWIAAMPDVEARLHTGARVLDVGCGAGWSAIVLARAFPRITIDGVDPDERSIEEANKNAREAGVADRVRFHARPVEGAPLAERYDLATLFECLHDMAYPVRALDAVRSRLAPGGAVLMTEEKVNESLPENMNTLGQLYYNFSVLHCLPQAMAHHGSAATGAVITPSTVKRYATEAGFTKVTPLPVENPLFRLYRLDKGA
jgi:2-polyprenyl-3-methyl-5-hydroxy-6-metoxy-1,4-benzoquinol methylase